MNLAAVEIKAFVPARDFEESKDFYARIGFEIPWSSDDLAYVRYGETSFLLQKFYVGQRPADFMRPFLVEDFDVWYQPIIASGVFEMFGLRIEPPLDLSLIHI